MDDQPEATAPPASEAPSRPARGPLPAKLDSLQRDELLRQVSDGKGIDQALRGMKASFRAYRNTIREDPPFREEVASARRARHQTLEEFAFLTATGDASAVDLLVKLLDRRDKVVVMNLARRERAKERAEEMEQRRLDRALKLHLAEMEAAARAKEKAGTTTADAEGLDFGKLSPEELANLRDLLAKVRGEDGPGEP